MPKRSEYRQGTPNWVDLQTTDQSAAKKFYTSLFGWGYDDNPVPGGGGVYSMATLNGEAVAAIAPMPPGAPEGMPPIWNTYIAVDDVDAVVDKVVPGGGQVMMPAFDIGDAGRMSFITDPTGAAVFRAEHDNPGVAPKDELRVQFGDVGWESRDILAALDDVEDLYFDVVSQIRMDRWSRGRVLLIGDAAGCISLLGGEGTGLAITEAYVLAGELARAGGDHRRAFDAYEKRLRPFIEGKQASAAKFIWFFATRTRFGLWFRNVAMRTMNFGPLATLFAGSVRDDFELPDYTW